MTTILIGLAGLARSGKDTAGDYLKDNHSFETYAFADPIKKAASEMFGVPLNYFYDESFKETVIEFWGYSPRQMAQLLGTEGGRDLFRKDIWVKRGELEWNNFCKYHEEISLETFGQLPCGLVITDVRFENEAEMIRAKGGVVIHIHRDTAKPVSEHVSERGVAINSNDVIIANNETVQDLYQNIDESMITIKKG